MNDPHAPTFTASVERIPPPWRPADADTAPDDPGPAVLSARCHRRSDGNRYSLRYQPARSAAGARLAVAGPARADRLRAVLAAAGAVAHAGRQPVAAGRRLLSRRAGRARRPVGAGVVRRDRRHAVEPQQHRRAAWPGAGWRLGLCGAGAALMSLARLRRPRRADHGQLHSGARAAAVHGRAAGVRRRLRACWCCAACSWRPARARVSTATARCASA